MTYIPISGDRTKTWKSCVHKRSRRRQNEKEPLGPEQAQETLFSWLGHSRMILCRSQLDFANLVHEPERLRRNLITKNLLQKTSHPSLLIKKSLYSRACSQ